MPTRDYVEDGDKLKSFLREFEDHQTGERFYMDRMQLVSNRLTRVFTIFLDHLYEHTGDEELIEAVESNTPRYVELLSAAIDSLLPEPSIPLHARYDVVDVLLDQRNQNSANNEADPNAPPPPPEFPPDFKRRYEIRLSPRQKVKPTSIREVKAQQIGALVKVTGVVTRLSEVKAKITVATYTCDQCGFEIYQEVTGEQFMPIFTCPSISCKTNHNVGKLFMQTRGSKFDKYQELRLQEESHQVPIGNVPRAIKVIVRGELTRSCSPGDSITVAGTFMPMIRRGFRQIQQGLVTDTFLHAMEIERHKKNYSEYTITEEMNEKILENAEDADIYGKLSRSIAPEIFGHEDVKKALLLLMVGSPTRVLADGMRIRGDINVCLMGDPGVAKSQLLKYVAHVAPRGVYTTGKGSSGVGLTAAVMRDPITKEMTLEGGALVLADKGVCCIDEFDKMDETDRTAIHEVMEQQTVSIAKAGITTTLNARVSILAAANPLYGRYNTRRSPQENINLPPALLSRFDLLFLILDKPDADFDSDIAAHICHVHRTGEAPDVKISCHEPTFVRAFIAQARRVDPFVSEEVTAFLVDAYVTMRQEERENPRGYVSARTLLGIIRLSLALARLRFSNEVEEGDITEAIRLWHMSSVSLAEEEEKRAGMDDKSSIYTIIRDYDQSHGKGGKVKYSEILPLVLAKGFAESLLADVLQEYENINVWSLNPARTVITFVS